MAKWKVPIFPHVQSWDAPWLPGFYQKVRDSTANGEIWCKGVDPPEQCPVWATDVLMLGRMHEPDSDSWADMARGSDGAVDFFNRMMPKWDRRRWVHAWTTGNEPHPPHDINFLKALNEFTVSLAELMRLEGLRSGVLNLSVGHPDIGLARYLGDAAEAGDYVVLHEYSAPAMWNDTSWHCRRTVRTYAEWRAAGFDPRPALIGEAGIDGGVIGQPKMGWKEYCKIGGVLQEGEYIQQLVEWYGVEILKDPDVLAAFCFTVCNWDWRSFDWTVELANGIAEKVALGVELDDGGNGEEPVPPNVIYIVNDMPVHPAKEYGSRPLEQIDSVVVHHSGYDYPVDATQEQAEAHCVRIAEHHINVKDWPGIAYHFVVDGLGRAYQVNNVSTVSYHAKPYNARSVGICMLGAFHLDRDPTDAQLATVRNIWKFMGAGIDILPHKRIVATACPGKIKRWWDKIVKDEPENGEDEMIKVVNDKGQEVMTWEQAKAAYGIDVVLAEPPEGATVWRLREVLYDDGPNTAWRLYALDENGAPLPKIVGFMGIHPPSGKDLEPDQAPRLSEAVWAQPDGRPNRAEVHAEQAYNWTNADGFIERALGSGSNYVPPGPTDAHWAWIMPGDNKWYSDVVTGIGMWDNHKMFWPRFFKQVQGDGGGEIVEGEYEIVVPEIVIPSFTMTVRPVKET